MNNSTGQKAMSIAYTSVPERMGHLSSRGRFWCTFGKTGRMTRLRRIFPISVGQDQVKGSSTCSKTVRKIHLVMVVAGISRFLGNLYVVIVN